MYFRERDLLASYHQDTLTVLVLFAGSKQVEGKEDRRSL